MNTKTTLLIGITKIGNSPCGFDTKYTGTMTPVSRHHLGLEDTENIQTLVFCKNPIDTNRYWTFGMTIDELKHIRNNQSIETVSYAFEFDPEYADINNSFFAECETNECDGSAY